MSPPQATLTNAATAKCVWCRALPVLVILAMLLSASGAQSTSALVPDLSNMLSLKNLGDYNQLIDCIAKIKEPFMRCNEEAQAKGEAVLRFVNEKSEMGTLLKCCGVWLVRDCWVQAASPTCTADQVMQLHNSPSKMMPGLDGLCHKYPAGSASCYTPHIVLGAVLGAVLVLVILIVVVAFFVGRHLYRRRKGSTKIDSVSMEDDVDRDRVAEKVKLTANSSGARGDNPLHNNNNNNIDYIDAEKGD